MTRSIVVLAVLALFLVPLAPTHAATTLLVANSSFEVDLGGWTTTGGSWALSNEGAFGSAQSAQLTSQSAGIASLAQCVDLGSMSAGQGITGGFFAKTVNHSQAVTMTVEFFSGPSCGGSVVRSASAPAPSPPLDSWRAYNLTSAIPAGGASSARVTLDVPSSSGGEETRLDIVWLRPSLPWNGHFDQDESGWVYNVGQFQRSGADGQGSPLGGLVASPDGSAAIFSQCFTLDAAAPSELYYFGASFKALASADDYFVLVRFQDAGDCSGTMLGQAALEIPARAVNDWTLIGTLAFKPPGSQSVVMFLGTDKATGSAGFVVDDVYLMPGELLLATGWEGGDNSKFSEVTEP